MTTITQQSFDIDALLHDLAVEQAPAWTGAPLQYTAEYHSPKELDDAWRQYQFINGIFGCVPNSHMWHRAVDSAWTGDGADVAVDGHTAHRFTVDLGCFCKRPYGDRCSCVTARLHQIVCDQCRWHQIGTEQHTVEAWHDHSFPGWRQLPVVPATVTGKARLRWIEQHYPATADPGFPIRTERSGAGTRHVPGRSPWGGYDLSA